MGEIMPCRTLGSLFSVIVLANCGDSSGSAIPVPRSSLLDKTQAVGQEGKARETCNVAKGLTEDGTPVEVTRTPEIPPGARKVRIHWKLKLPSLPEGQYVFQSANEFGAFLRKHRVNAARRPELYEKWNALDFVNQMAIIFVDTVSSGDTSTIDAIWNSGEEILVVIRHEFPPPLPAGFFRLSEPGSIVMGVAINKSELPVRFVKTYAVSVPEHTPR